MSDEFIERVRQHESYIKNRVRLAKIEILEEVKDGIVLDGLDVNCIMFRINTMLSDLKGEQ